MSRRRIACPGCQTQLVVTPAAEERGRMRCPQCQEIVEVSDEESAGERLRRITAERAAARQEAEDADDRERFRGKEDRPRKRRRRREESSGSGAKVFLWLLGGGGLLAFLCCGGLGVFVALMGRSEAEESPVPLMQARAGFRTNIVSPQIIADGPAPPPPPGSKFNLIRYQSPAGNLAAYVSRDPGDGKKHPAIVWAHGGFGGIGEDTWEEDSPQMIFAASGLIVMVPSWRGEADNPGKYEMFYGEVDDAVAAVEHLAKLPYVDPSRIYMAGHSTGGTITLLTVEATTRLRAAFSFGGAPDIGSVLGIAGIGYGNTPFAHRDKKERRLRSAIDFIQHVRTPTFYFEGDLDSDYLKDAQRMEKWARKGGAPVSVFLIEEGDHFDIVEPICQMLAKKIAADRGPVCNIAMTQKEVQSAYDNEQ